MSDPTSILKECTDRCTGCGCSIYRHEGCPISFLCADCCIAAHPEHTKFHPHKESIAMPTRSFICDITRAHVGRFHLGSDMKLHCTGTAVKTDAAAVRALQAEPPEAEDAVPIDEDLVRRSAAAIQAQTEGRLLHNRSGCIDGSVEVGKNISASDPEFAVEIVWHADAPQARPAPQVKRTAKEESLDLSGNCSFERRG